MKTWLLLKWIDQISTISYRLPNHLLINPANHRQRTIRRASCATGQSIMDHKNRFVISYLQSTASTLLKWTKIVWSNQISRSWIRIKSLQVTTTTVVYNQRWNHTNSLVSAGTRTFCAMPITSSSNLTCIKSVAWFIISTF